MHSQTTIDTVAKLFDLARWIDAMPEMPTRHGADAMLETYYNCVDDALGYDPAIRTAFDYANEQMETQDSYTETELWRVVAAAMEIELQTE